jgi:putative inorganic carbon (HCO3(-)) transporter
LGFFLTIIYLLLVMIRPQDFMDGIKGLPIMDVMAVLCLGVVFMEGRISGARLGRSTTSKLVFLFMLWCGLGHLRMGNFGLVTASWMEFAKTAIVFYLVLLNVDTIPRLKLFTWIMILTTTVLALQAVSLFYSGSTFSGAEALMRGGGIFQARGIGIFADPNDLGLHIVTWVPFLLPSVHRPLLSGTMWTGLILLVPVITGIAFTRSRGSLMGLAAVFWFYFYKRVGIITSIIALAVVLAVLMTLPRMDTISTKEGSARSRMEHWSAGIDMFKYRPITGVGHRRFTVHHVQTAHNSFVLVFAELGIVGTFLWISMFFRPGGISGSFPAIPGHRRMCTVFVMAFWAL